MPICCKKVIGGTGRAFLAGYRAGALVEVSSLFARKAVAQTSRHAADRALARAGLTRSDLAEQPDQIDIARHHLLFEALAESERPVIGFHMRTSASMRCDDFGPVGMAIKSAPTLRRSFERLDRYARLFNPYSVFDVLDNDTECWWVNRRLALDCDGSRLSNEAALGTFVALWRDANGPQFNPMRVQFSHQPVGGTAPLEDHFRCPITFGADVDAIIMRQEDTSRPNRVGDQQIWEFLRDHLENSIAATTPDRIDREVIVRVAKTLSDGVPRLDQVASHLGVGSRTLQRRLAEQGHTYQSLVDEARREVALNLVEGGIHSLAEVAFLTGFSEQASFTRAFKRWSGKPPRAYRESRLL